MTIVQWVRVKCNRPYYIGILLSNIPFGIVTNIQRVFLNGGL